jgi:hypothetical protein
MSSRRCLAATTGTNTTSDDCRYGRISLRALSLLLFLLIIALTLLPITAAQSQCAAGYAAVLAMRLSVLILSPHIDFAPYSRLWSLRVFSRTGKASRLALPRRHVPIAWPVTIAAPARGMRTAAWALAVRVLSAVCLMLL